MSKIICEVCGSSYAETATQCPICGTPKSEAAKPVAEATTEPAKGGKFVRSNNTRKPAKRDHGKATGGEDKPSNIVMIIIVAVLLLAIIAVCVFIATRFLGNGDNNTTDFTSLIPLALRKIRMLICIGEDNHRLHEVFSGIIPTIVDANSIKDAVTKALYSDINNSVVLFSPACENGVPMREQGNEFQREVYDL